MKKNSVIMFFLSILVLYTSCFPPSTESIFNHVQLYPEPKLNREKVSFISVRSDLTELLPEKIDDYYVSDNFGIISMNRIAVKMGFEEPKWIVIDFHLMPGEHTITFGSQLESGEGDQMASLDSVTIKFQTLPGHVYTIISGKGKEIVKTEYLGVLGDKNMYREHYIPYAYFRLSDNTNNFETIFDEKRFFTLIK